MADYEITIKRTGRDKGTLEYKGTFDHTCDCWWDPADKIKAGTYEECSKTYLASKKNSKGGKREGIYFPKVPSRKGIFIHYWPGPGKGKLKVWSDGCTVVLEKDMLKMWKDITPSNGRNVTVKVVDS